MSNKAVIAWSIAYWACAALVILVVSALGDCFDREACEAGIREGELTFAAFFGAVYAVALLIRLVRLSRR